MLSKILLKTERVSVDSLKRTTGFVPPQTLDQALHDLEILMGDYLSSALPILRDVSMYLIQSGGKRIRPSFLFLTAQLFGPITKKHLQAAACLELIHTATLFHDDIMDNGDIRRGLPAAHKVWSNDHSILAGDFLMCSALSLLTSIKDWNVAAIVQKTSTDLIQGQAMELFTDSPLSDFEPHYFNIIHFKTAALFETATSLVGYLNQTDEGTKNSLSTFGRNIGTYFQIMDDVKDYTATQKALGKKVGQDFYERKITLPIILAHQRSDNDQKLRIESLFQNPSEKGLGEILDILEESSALTTATSIANDYKEKALAELEKLPSKPETQRQLVDTIQSIAK